MTSFFFCSSLHLSPRLHSVSNPTRPFQICSRIGSFNPTHTQTKEKKRIPSTPLRSPLRSYPCFCAHPPFLAWPTPVCLHFCFVLCHSAHFGVLVQGRRHAGKLLDPIESDLFSVNVKWKKQVPFLLNSTLAHLFISFHLFVCVCTEPIHSSTESNLVFRPNPPRHDIGRRPTENAHDATKPRIRTSAPSAPTGATAANPTPASASIASTTDPGSATGSTGSTGSASSTTGSTATVATSASPGHSIHATNDDHARNANICARWWDSYSPRRTLTDDPCLSAGPSCSDATPPI